MLTIAATHSQARYALPPAVQGFLRPASRGVIAHAPGFIRSRWRELLLAGEADIGVATEALADYPELVALPSYQWTHSVIVPPGACRWPPKPSTACR